MGKLYVIGFGPGDEGSMTARCRECLQASDVVVGYSRYISLLKPFFEDKTFRDTGMTKEVERCQTALELAREGKIVSVVSSGDSGIYGMASIVLELAEEDLAAETPALSIEIVPGITAASSGAALLGAPIGHDFAVISLSDLLTPWELIERRLRTVAAGDFVLCLYNPGSMSRSEHLRNACSLLLETLPASRPCGIAYNIGRTDQSMQLLTLGELKDHRATMTETIFIGNSQTKNLAGYLVTPRGYLND